MKKTFGELKTYYASKRGYDSFNSLTSAEQTVAIQDINKVIEIVWYHKQWGFAKGSYQFTTIAPLSAGTVSGTAGEKTVTFSGITLSESYYGVPIRGQYLYIGGDVYKISRFKSSSSLVLDSGLKSTLSSASYQVLFVNYPSPYGLGMIRKVDRDTEEIEIGSSDNVGPSNEIGTARFIFPAGQQGFDLAEITGDLADDADTITSVSGLTPGDEHIGLTIVAESTSEVFKIIDYSGTTFILDRKYQGTAISSGTFIVSPRETPLIGVYPYPQNAQLISIDFTKAHPELVDDLDRTLLPTDTPVLAGIDFMAVKWDSVGEGNVNEKLLNDKKFVQSMRVLNARGSKANIGFTLPNKNRFGRKERTRCR